MSVDDAGSANAEHTEETQEEVESAPAHNGSATGPDVPVSTVVRLMGVASSREMALLERKLDLTNQKVANIGHRLDRISEQMLELFHDIDRTNVQFGDLKDFLRNILGAVLKNVDEETRKQLSGKTKAFTEEQAGTTAAEKKDVKIISSE
ncbi:MAG: hypothetical protein KDD66_11895 [Bdellovibrionales bacterium]|nr:hypothetical protein [Bdellovibrionales bacterium]